MHRRLAGEHGATEQLDVATEIRTHEPAGASRPTYCQQPKCGLWIISSELLRGEWRMELTNIVFFTAVVFVRGFSSKPDHAREPERRCLADYVGHRSGCHRHQLHRFSGWYRGQREICQYVLLLDREYRHARFDCNRWVVIFGTGPV